MSDPSWIHAVTAALTAAAPDLRATPHGPGRAPRVAADRIADLVPGADAAAVLFPPLRSDGRVDRPFHDAASDDVLLSALAAEGLARDGPVRTVRRASDGASLHVPDIRDDTRWPAFTRRLTAVAADVRAVAVTPLHVASRGMVVLTAHRPHGLDDVVPHLGRLVAPLELFLGLAWSETRSRHLGDLVSHRRTIDVATGVIMVVEGVSAGAALDRLRGRSRISGRTLHDVADDVVARHRPG